MINSIDLLDFVGLCRGTGDESGARGHVLKRDWVVLGMNFCFHNWFGLPPRYRRGGAGRGKCSILRMCQVVTSYA